MLKRRAHNRKAIIYECSSRSFNKSSISFHHSLSFQFYTDQIFSRHILNYKDNFQNIELIYICNITLYNIHLYLYMLLVIWYGLYININDEQFSTRHSSNSNLYYDQEHLASLYLFKWSNLYLQTIQIWKYKVFKKKYSYTSIDFRYPRYKPTEYTKRTDLRFIAEEGFRSSSNTLSLLN